MTDAAAVPGSEFGMPSATGAMSAEDAAELSALFKALADPLRLRMLSAVASDPRGECCVCDLASLAEVSQPTISHHLKVLKDAQVLTAERRGTWVWYRVVPGRETAISTLLRALNPSLHLIPEGSLA
ncbi:MULTISPECIES: ArsR/SmtB family transcription factor [Micrococcales]|uniref:ArsR/SmtB family transcription factor n=1 Tax=Micrococcales TaxID=85006 RepID=UPI0025E6D26E|nr:metalloregulator ArsR/SmtB family transcription factor [Microbacterium sp. UBA837]|tara:strand:+ start:12956 stop:13336 length:381 start_codon:yes stop_codon:yes gene_type:complete